MTLTQKLVAPSIPLINLKNRREKLLAMLPANSVVVVVSNPERTRSHDTEYRYRQSSDLIYLSGFLEPESAIVLTNIPDEPQYTMFVRPKDRSREIWTGIRAGVEGARSSYGCDEAYTNDEFDEIISRLLAKANDVYYKLDRNEFFDAQFLSVWRDTQKPLRNPEDIVSEMRLFKDASEIEVMRHAANLSAKAHCLAMQACQPGMYEYQLAAIIEANCMYSGAQSMAYDSIVASGNNAIVLHYNSNSALLEDGQLVLIDAACEYNGYASDITRTFPVSGKFSKAQREIYELVLAAQIAAIEAARPKIALADVHNAACKVLTEGLIKLKILPEEACTVDAGQKPAKVAGVDKEPGTLPGSRQAAPASFAEGTGEAAALHARAGADKEPGTLSGSRQAAPASFAEGTGEAAALHARANAEDIAAALPRHHNNQANDLLTLKAFYPHGTSHWIGIDVHDVGNYKTNDGTRTDKGTGKQRILEPGMAFTVEPGLYFDAHDERVPKQYRGIGIRVEDDIVITKEGSVVLTAGVPKTVEEIESLMSVPFNQGVF